MCVCAIVKEAIASAQHLVRVREQQVCCIASRSAVDKSRTNGTKHAILKPFLYCRDWCVRLEMTTEKLWKIHKRSRDTLHVRFAAAIYQPQDINHSPAHNPGHLAL